MTTADFDETIRRVKARMRPFDGPVTQRYDLLIAVLVEGRDNLRYSPMMAVIDLRDPSIAIQFAVLSAVARVARARVHSSVKAEMMADEAIEFTLRAIDLHMAEGPI